jgi:VWFA-related protein
MLGPCPFHQQGCGFVCEFRLYIIPLASFSFWRTDRMNMLVKTALCVLAFALPAAAQTQNQPDQVQPDLTTNVNLVTLLATVHDRDGHIVNNLTPDDFVLEEDGVPQKVRYFSRESNLPLTVGVLVDTSRSQADVLGEESRASSIFLDKVLREDKDEAFIVHFDKRVEILQALTSSHDQLAAALERLQIPGEFATLIYSATRQSSEEVMRNQRGRKALILLTDGVAYKDPVSIGTAIEFAQRADTILYSIRFSGPIEAYRPIRAAVMGAAKEHGKLSLQRMARETGGVSYEVTKNQTIEAIYTQIEEALRNQYSIGYTPGRTAPDGKYHKIKLIAKNHDLIIDTRDGYFAQ